MIDSLPFPDPDLYPGTRLISATSTTRKGGFAGTGREG